MFVLSLLRQSDWTREATKIRLRPIQDKGEIIMVARDGIPVRKGYSMVTVYKRLFRARLWKLTDRYPADFPLDGFKHLFCNLYWKVKEKDCA